MQDIFFYNPSFAPVRSQHSRLIRRRRRPGACGLGHLKAPDRNIIDSRPLRVKTAPAHTDLCQFLIRICPLKIGIDYSFIIRNLREPLIQRIFRAGDGLPVLCPGRIVSFCPYSRILQFFQRIRLVHGLSVQVHIPRMNAAVLRPDQPVAPQALCKRIIRSEKAVRDFCPPYISPDMLPVFHLFRALDHCMLSRSRLVRNPLRVVSSSAGRFHPLPVHSFMDYDGISGLRCLCRF